MKYWTVILSSKQVILWKRSTAQVSGCRYCSSGNRRCPVSGATLKFNKGKVVHTIDFALRNLIRAQAAFAKVPILNYRAKP